MAALEPVVREHERMAKKQALCREQTISDLDKMIAATQSTAAELRSRVGTDDESPEADAMQLMLLSNKMKGAADSLPGAHRDLYGLISKFGKAVDKVFQGNIERVSNPEAFADKDTELKQVIAQHLLRQGRFGIAKTFLNEAEVQMDQSDIDPFMDMYVILESLKRQDLLPALQWADQHSKGLEALGSDLEFRLHRLQFTRLLLTAPREEALHYARQHLPKFATTQMKSIQRLMGSFLFYGRLDGSPYSDLADPAQWAEIAHLFARERNAFYLSAPHHGNSVTVGCKALPTLLKMASVMQNKKDAMWSQKDELPVEIDLGKDHHYHSVFACPVSREQSTDDNPPMLLPCGHVIAQLSLMKLSKGSRFKCPYCPQEQTPNEAREIYF